MPFFFFFFLSPLSTDVRPESNEALSARDGQHAVSAVRRPAQARAPDARTPSNSQRSHSSALKGA